MLSSCVSDYAYVEINRRAARKGQKYGSRSWVWNHFEAIYNENQLYPDGKHKVACNHCGREFSSTTSTGTLKTHLVAHHNVKPELEQQAATSNTTTTKSVQKVDVETLVFQHFVPIPDKKKVKCEQCDGEFDISSSVSELKQHLEAVHEIDLDLKSSNRRFFVPKTM